MGLTEYRALLIDCDEVLVDRDSGVWAALQPLLENRLEAPDKGQILAEYKDVIRSLYPRYAELGFSGMLCFAHRQMAERLEIKSSWEEGMSFARSVPGWTLFEDVPGAMLYLRKFYHLRVYADRDVEDRGVLCERLGLLPEHLLSLADNPLDGGDWLAELDIDPADTLLLSRPPAQALGEGGLCLIRRGAAEHRKTCPADFCINSMADLVRQHQLSLRC
ncbi:hypothetical protein M2401_005863 [Pseudomonas sp. JUb42]|jgi:hypothetical protein|uniref:HAD family hydrolase n=1 Tax=Pseudomonas sp. JUb42 TaxID=2940611 RepID=UPI002168FAE8|nr:2-haloalkanoic acid dehalogenase [Pseudomonas sp. JUb42]MCS3472099.1 hypothetical protein [Pseudomonas sp. JUb42]